MSVCDEEVPQSPRVKWDAVSALELQSYDQKLDQMLGDVTVPWSALNYHATATTSVYLLMKPYSIFRMMGWGEVGVGAGWGVAWL